MKLRRLLSFGMLVAAPVFAGTKVVTVESFSYPSPAATHLDILQASLAREAVEACGSKEDVVGITDISIKIRKGVNDPVARLTDEGTHGLALNLWYPKLRAVAKVQCAD